ncbi:MAG: cell division ATP-binding protein FtsE [Deltaproteobacteria bacterium]|uniref:Cell division ATP-binding protein FtsE n=1 Tax=Candidatus Zymogenus saltonus TaxID=2844893 RepID=A0A9D8PPR6_9DELT|nr:cell division ATP-binding protein FtsE [Candidatus Zymogenus saltonus]
MIRLYHVYKNYGTGVDALSDINLHVDRGEFVFITGPSGAGKTTLLKLLFMAERATKGQILINDLNIETLKRRKIPYLRRAIGVVFQDFKLLNSITVLDNVSFPLEVLGLPRREIRKRVMRVLKFVGLNKKYKHYPLELSGGEQQRVAIARAVVNEPPILLADEPTGNLDSELTLDIIRLLDYIHKRGATVIMATHNKDIVERFHKRLVSLDRGRIAN